MSNCSQFLVRTAEEARRRLEVMTNDLVILKAIKHYHTILSLVMFLQFRLTNLNKRFFLLVLGRQSMRK